jgi:hypothetical protein
MALELPISGIKTLVLSMNRIGYRDMQSLMENLPHLEKFCAFPPQRQRHTHADPCTPGGVARALSVRKEELRHIEIDAAIWVSDQAHRYLPEPGDGDNGAWLESFAGFSRLTYLSIPTELLPTSRVPDSGDPGNDTCPPSLPKEVKDLMPILPRSLETLRLPQSVSTGTEWNDGAIAWFESRGGFSECHNLRRIESCTHNSPLDWQRPEVYCFDDGRTLRVFRSI